MFASPEEALLQLRQIFGGEGYLVITRRPDGAILAGQTPSGESNPDPSQPSSISELIPPWERESLRNALQHSGPGWQPLSLTIRGRKQKALVLNLEIARIQASAIYLTEDENDIKPAPAGGLALLARAGIRAAAYYPHQGEVIWFGSHETQAAPLSPTLPQESEPEKEFTLSGIDLVQIMAGTASSGQPFSATSVWIEKDCRHYDLSVWAELHLGHVSCVYAILAPSARIPHQERILSAAGVFAAFTTNLFGRQPSLHIHPSDLALREKLNALLHSGHSGFQDHCRVAAENGFGTMTLTMMPGREMVIETTTEVKAGPGRSASLFHILRTPSGSGAINPEHLDHDRERETDLLLKEANHRIKNSITLAASLLQIQAGDIKSDKAKAALADSVNRMHTIAQLHQALYKQSSAEKTLDVKPYLAEILERLRKSASGKDIGFKADIESHRLPTGMVSTLGMLVNEIVQNSLKHAFTKSNKGLIGVSFYKIENLYYLSAEDNGGGASDPDSWKGSDSLGSSLIEEFVQQLGGKLRLERQLGTRYLITFRVPNE